MGLQVGGWCADNQYICTELWWCGWQNYALASLALSAAWCVVYFAILCFVFPKWRSWAEKHPSKYENENSSHFFTGYATSTLNAIIVTCMAFGPMLVLWGTRDPRIEFSRPNPATVPFSYHVALSANSALIFQCYAIGDLITGMAFGMLQNDIILHHSVLIFFCMLVTYNCFGQELAASMLVMELSTIPCNYFLYFRYRLGDAHWTVALSFLSFAGIFFVVRIMAMGYTSFNFFMAVFHGGPFFDGVVKWHLGFICISLVLIWVLQLYWGHSIWKKILRFMDRPDDELPPMALLVKTVWRWVVSCGRPANNNSL